MGFLNNTSEEFIDAAAIMAIVLVNGILGFLQERKAEAALEALMKMSAPQANVLRGGKEQRIPSKDLVPGDIIYLEEGDLVPADVRLLEGAGLLAEEAALTGESVPSEKDADKVLAAETPLGDRGNMSYASTTIVHGRAQAIVAATGMDTEIGHIADLVSATEQKETPLQQRLERVGQVLVFVCLGICGLVFALGTIEGHPWQIMFLTAVSLAVAAIPEGLPAIVTIALALGVERMAKRNAIMRKLASVETLGSTTIICTDKTGTLTQNRMFVKEMYLPHDELVTIGDVIPSNLPYPLERLLVAATLCNNLYLKVGPDGLERLKKGEVLGDPTEAALVAAAASTGALDSESFGRLAHISEIPFDSRRKMMSAIYENPETGIHFSFIKGAPDTVLSRCTHIDKPDVATRLQHGNHRVMEVGDLERIRATIDRMSLDALRVLAVAYRDIPADFDHSHPELAEEELVFLGLVGMHDPARPEVKAAMDECRTAGIRSIMVTGDGLLTAKAVAQEVGLLTAADNYEVIEGIEAEKLSGEELIEKVPKIAVYSRVNPETKLRIVEAWQARDEVVAMTGDGVNDAPALRKADIGIAMGIRGTDVTKGAADMVLADDNFASIVNAVEEGRRIFDNIKKFIHFILSCNIGEITTLLFAVLFFLPIPLLPIHILWVNLVTDGLPALALGIDPATPDIMQQDARKRGRVILTGRRWVRMTIQGLMKGIFTLAAFLISIHMLNNGVMNKQTILEAQTMAFTVLVLSQLFHSLSCRSQERLFFSKGMLSNKWLLYTLFGSIIIHVSVIYVPFLQVIFNTYSLTLTDWLITGSLSLAPFVINETLKVLWKFRE
jgi:P-type Ca2+ transporter type 2C